MRGEERGERRGEGREGPPNVGLLLSGDYWNGFINCIKRVTQSWSDGTEGRNNKHRSERWAIDVYFTMNDGCNWEYSDGKLETFYRLPLQSNDKISVRPLHWRGAWETSKPKVPQLIYENIFSYLWESLLNVVKCLHSYSITARYS